MVKGGPDGNYPKAFTPFAEGSGGFSGIIHGLVFASNVTIKYYSKVNSTCIYWI